MNIIGGFSETHRAEAQNSLASEDKTIYLQLAWYKYYIITILTKSIVHPIHVYF